MAESIAHLALASSTEDEAEAVVWLNTSARTVKGELLLLDSGIHLGGSSKAQIPSKTACTSRVHKPRAQADSKQPPTMTILRIRLYALKSLARGARKVNPP